ncbi:hypothetical protein Gogos_001270 [Gossypium gossypioides]|uniref:Uncharacterized protein n=1 Tax=Gossypium gossypioides TaxID=34282 RepID=A0A7J9CVH4_GOSGO|nr:hypothetical protein [Gossypium gossypioides]
MYVALVISCFLKWMRVKAMPYSEGECVCVPPENSLGIFTPTWFTSATFFSKDDHRKVVAGTNNHQNATTNYYIMASARFQNESVWERVTGVVKPGDQHN